MKALNEPEPETVRAMLLRCAKTLPEGFCVDLSADPQGWAAASRAIGSKRLCRGVADLLCGAYEAQYGEPFLFSERCMTFELKYHLNAYLSVKGLRRLRHVTTLLFPKRTVERLPQHRDRHKRRIPEEPAAHVPLLFRHPQGVPPHGKGPVRKADRKAVRPHPVLPVFRRFALAVTCSLWYAVGAERKDKG